VYGGYLTDKISSYRLILAFTGFFTLGFIGMCVTAHLWMFFLFLVAFNFAYSVIDVVVKAAFGKLLPEAERGKVFSVRYSLINIGYAVGPFIGAGFAHMDMKLPFLISAALGVGTFLTYMIWGDRTLTPTDRASPPISFASVGRILLKDYCLVCFTIGGALSAVAFGQFTGYISQYLVTTSTPEFTYQVISAVVAVNVTVVICLQYLVGKRITNEHLNRWLTAGFSLFLLGVVGFALSTSVLHWALAVGIFTVGGSHCVPRRVHVHRSHRARALARHVLRCAKPVEPWRRTGPGIVRICIGIPATAFHVLYARCLHRGRWVFLFDGCLFLQPP
jgi:MFS family permease